MRYAQIRPYDVANGPGIRVTLFVTGCPHNCKGCFNVEYQNYQAGEIWNYNAKEELEQALAFPWISGLSLLGGEPMEHAKALKDLILSLDHKPKSIWIYSGYTYQEILQDQDKKALMELADVLVDGRFVEELLDLKLAYRGSSNQRLIDIPKTLETGKVVLWKNL